jgi:hypothetical protein
VILKSKGEIRQNKLPASRRTLVKKGGVIFEINGGEGKISCFRRNSSKKGVILKANEGEGKISGFRRNFSSRWIEL